MAFDSLYVVSRCKLPTEFFNADRQNMLLTGLVQAVTRGYSWDHSICERGIPRQDFLFTDIINGTHLLMKLTSLVANC